MSRRRQAMKDKVMAEQLAHAIEVLGDAVEFLMDEDIDREVIREALTTVEEMP